MAFSGLQVVCGRAGRPGDTGKAAEIFNAVDLAWSESPAANTTTTNSASTVSNGYPVFRIYASADCYVALGTSPDPTTSPRLFVKATEYYDIYVKPGDKLKWIAA